MIEEAVDNREQKAKQRQKEYDKKKEVCAHGGLGCVSGTAHNVRVWACGCPSSHVASARKGVAAPNLSAAVPCSMPLAPQPPHTTHPIRAVQAA
jgi:hypothetical protein